MKYYFIRFEVELRDGQTNIAHGDMILECEDTMTPLAAGAVTRDEILAKMERERNIPKEQLLVRFLEFRRVE